MFSAFAKRASREFGEWKKKIKENDCGYHQPRKFLNQLLEFPNDSIRKMEEIAVPAPPCDIESFYDESKWETMKKFRAAEEKYAKIVIVTFPGLLKRPGFE